MVSRNTLHLDNFLINPASEVFLFIPYPVLDYYIHILQMTDVPLHIVPDSDDIRIFTGGDGT